MGGSGCGQDLESSTLQASRHTWEGSVSGHAFKVVLIALGRPIFIGGGTILSSGIHDCIKQRK